MLEPPPRHVYVPVHQSLHAQKVEQPHPVNTMPVAHRHLLRDSVLVLILTLASPPPFRAALDTPWRALFEVRISHAQVSLLRRHANAPHVHKACLSSPLPLAVIPADLVVLERQSQILLHAAITMEVKVSNGECRDEVRLGRPVAGGEHAVVLQSLLELVGFVVRVQGYGSSAVSVDLGETVLLNWRIHLALRRPGLQLIHHPVRRRLVVRQRRGTRPQHTVVTHGSGPVGRHGTAVHGMVSRIQPRAVPSTGHGRIGQVRGLRASTRCGIEVTVSQRHGRFDVAVHGGEVPQEDGAGELLSSAREVVRDL
mmetsp:Transcript_11336/g.24189  ORF Transcript_11336/g.24189 Transcript_11336/m.24189 type:complete len:311 (-) Transcript_11336:738-1670(-)